jgi:hypothetical protein
MTGVLCNRKPICHSGDVIGHSPRLGIQVVEAWLSGQRPCVIHVQVEQVRQQRAGGFRHAANPWMLVKLPPEQALQREVLNLNLGTELE